MDTSQPWWTLRDAAAYAQVSVATLRRELKAGRLRHARIGGRTSIRVKAEWIDQWLESNATPVEVLR
jgi:excisionase family DNA binding protein